MKNLYGEDLKKCFAKCLKFAFDNMVNPHANIRFCFFTYDFIKFKPVKIQIVFKEFHFKCVSLHSISIREQINIIVNNICFDHFTLVNQKFTIGKSECHGHGEFYGTDSFTFNFMRYEE